MSKKGGKKKGKKGGGDVAGVDEGHPMKDLLSKEMKIMHLTEKLKVFGREKDEAHTQRKALEEEFKAYRATQEDMVVFLNEKLDDQYNKIDQLEHELVNLRLEKSNFSSDLEAKFTEEATALQDDLTTATGRIASLESELSSLVEFKTHKDALESKTARLEEELAMVKKETQLQLLQLDRQHIREKERMASEVKERIAETEKVTWAKWQSMYDDNTMKAMQKNKEMTVELQYQSRAAEKLVANNKRLQQQYKEAQHDIKVHTNLEEEFGKSIQAYKAQIKRLQARLDRYEHGSFIDVAQPPASGDDSSSSVGGGGSGSALSARQRSKQAAEARAGDTASKKAGASDKAATRGSGRAAVVTLSLGRGGGAAAGGDEEWARALATAQKSAADAAAEIERLNTQITKYRARARQGTEEATAAKRALAAHHANVDQLGAFLLTAMEDLRKRKQKLAKLPHTKRLPRSKQTGEMLIPDIPYIQLPLQSREELVAEFIAHVRSLKLQVAASVGVRAMDNEYNRQHKHHHNHHHHQQQLLPQRPEEEGGAGGGSRSGMLPDIHTGFGGSGGGGGGGGGTGSADGGEFGTDISAPLGNTVGTQCSLDSGLYFSNSVVSLGGFWGGEATPLSSAGHGGGQQGVGASSSSSALREDLDSRAFITSAQLEQSGRVAGQGLLPAHDSARRPYTLH